MVDKTVGRQGRQRTQREIKMSTMVYSIHVER